MPDAASSLEILMGPALEGEKSAVEKFLRALLRERLFVPEREQAQKMSDAPRYPDPFLNILGVQDKERVVVAAFTRPALIHDWCGNELRYRELQVPELLGLMPEEWWICINPAAPVEKELSPWEIEQLKAGEQGIPAIVEEIFQEQRVEALEVQPVPESEYPLVFQETRAFAASEPQILRMFLVRQVGRDLDDKTILKLFLGVEVADTLRTDELRQKLQAVVDRCQVGNDPITVNTSGSKTHDLTFGFFANSAPFYVTENSSAPISLWQKFRSKLKPQK